jgi:hypothetical protein
MCYSPAVPGVSTSEFCAFMTETESMMSGTIYVLVMPRFHDEPVQFQCERDSYANVEITLFV